MKLCVLGLGYIGLPTAVMFAKHGVDVHGVDVNPYVVRTLQQNEVHIEEPGLKEMLEEVMEQGNFSVSTEVQYSDAFIIAVPTPITDDKKANLNYVENAAKMIVPYLKRGNLVVLESTSPPKTVEEVIVPILKKSGLKIGEELFVSHSPERVLPGRLFEELIFNDRIVGGINKKSSDLTVRLYRTFVKGTIHVTDATTAEMVKLMENTYRDINIAFANELARVAEKVGFNVWEAIELANCHPRVNIHTPGPGVGGHCIAVDPWFIIEQAYEDSTLMLTARNINDSTPQKVTNYIEDCIKDISNPVVTILGLAFKGNIDDMRESPSIKIVEQLKLKGYKVKIFDPLVKEEYENKYENINIAAQNSDIIVILTDHDLFKSVNYKELKNVMRSLVILDTRNLLQREEILELGYSYYTLGAPLNNRKTLSLV